MKIFFGILIGLVLAIMIAAGAAYMAFGNIRDFEERDKSGDVSMSYDLTGFDRIVVGGVYELNVRVGEGFSIEVSGAPDEMERMEIEVEDGVLRLGQQERMRGKRRWRDQGLSAEITMPALAALNVSGVTDANVTGVDADDFSARLSGVGEIDIAGTCGSLTARVSGVGALDAENLQCVDVEVRVSGIGDAEVYASQSVHASVSGIGSIGIYGSPSVVETDKSLFADISVK